MLPEKSIAIFKINYSIYIYRFRCYQKKSIATCKIDYSIYIYIPDVSSEINNIANYL